MASRRTFVLGWLALRALAGVDRGILDLLETVAAALTEGELRVFLGCFEKELADRPEFERDAAALMEQHLITCSIEVLGEEGEGDRRRLELDWMMDLKARIPGAPPTSAAPGRFVRRREQVRCEVRRRGRRWRFTAFEPLTLFAP
jgi:hypothetical protein